MKTPIPPEIPGARHQHPYARELVVLLYEETVLSLNRAVRSIRKTGRATPIIISSGPKTSSFI
jgi:predicted HTH domain antitoxin